MNKENYTRVYLYTRFERFWHWVQALMIIVLLVTGMEVHGLFSMLGFKSAVEIHTITALCWLGLYVFIIFWQATTGEWKHYIPTTVKLAAVARFYMVGIFRGEPHPVPKTGRAKQNPLQRLTYLGVALALVPFQMVTGLLYWLYNSWADMGTSSLSLGTVAVLHTLGAFLILAFLIVHVYMTTTGHTVFAHIKAMFTGFDEVPAARPRKVK